MLIHSLQRANIIAPQIYLSRQTRLCTAPTMLKRITEMPFLSALCLHHPLWPAHLRGYLCTGPVQQIQSHSSAQKNNSAAAELK